MGDELVHVGGMAFEGDEWRLSEGDGDASQDPACLGAAALTQRFSDR